MKSIGITSTKFLVVTKLVFMVGYEVANRPERIVVDNPFSSWEQ